ncbi:MAG TPA: polymer-forming cytoskeletal protein [Candidatus Acidoferrales bacterium]|jgi:cytoskeletal protein CcmA (bactofilin family)|nr:polymer-forming cytoskeletal protein [Candidatus Acidoferrales bacterium]
MPAKKQDKILVGCPHCGHQQPEAREAFSTICKECGQHFHVQEALNPKPKTAARAPRQRHVICFECGAELDVPASAESSMCKKCSRYLDLHDYKITTAQAKNYKTKGRFVVEPKGYVFNTDTIGGEVVIKGKFHGKLTAEQSLTIYSGADIKGSITAAHLIIPAENHFRWPDRLQVGTAEIAGELAANMHATGTVTLKATARWFGDLVAAGLVVEAGAVVVGKLQIGVKPKKVAKGGD